MPCARRSAPPGEDVSSTNPHQRILQPKTCRNNEVHWFDRLIAGDVLEPDTLTQMPTLAPLSDQPDEIHNGGMGVYTDRSSRRGQNYHHGGGGPGYNLGATIYTDTPVGRLSIAVFVNSSCEPRADAARAVRAFNTRSAEGTRHGAVTLRSGVIPHQNTTESGSQLSGTFRGAH